MHYHIYGTYIQHDQEMTGRSNQHLLQGIDDCMNISYTRKRDHATYYSNKCQPTMDQTESLEPDIFLSFQSS